MIIIVCKSLLASLGISKCRVSSPINFAAWVHHILRVDGVGSVDFIWELHLNGENSSKSRR